MTTPPFEMRHYRGPTKFPKLEPGLPVRGQWAKLHLEYALKESLLAKFPGQLPFDHDDGEHIPPVKTASKELLSKFPRFDRATPKITKPKVAIVGAGAAGLFAGMILDYLRANVKGFDVEYDILEAAEKARVGGRLFTYEFEPSGASNPEGPHDYFDVGAMRFPENDIMARLFGLFHHLGMEKKTLEENTPVGSLIPYYMQNIEDDNVKEPWCFNNICKFGDYKYWAKQAGRDRDAFSLNEGTNYYEDDSSKFIISPTVLGQYPDKTLNGAIAGIRDKLKNDPKSSSDTDADGFKALMDCDQYSTRQFLAVSQQVTGAKWNYALPPFNYETIEFLETFNGGTNWYDQAHSETVLESLDFDYNSDDENDINWYAILGGAKQLAIRMEGTLANKPEYLSRVTAIKDGAPEHNRATLDVEISKTSCGCNTSAETRNYHGVFNSTTLGAFKRINTDLRSLEYTTRQAVRSLGYGPSAKVGIKFKRPWWIQDLGGGCIKKGGLGHSDLSIRTCVYPSYNIGPDNTDKPAVLLCSYTWQQDAERLGALFSTSKNHDQQLKDEAELRELLLRDLARLHSYNESNMTEDQVYSLIEPLYLDHYAHDWTHDPNTAGAFAFFRPQQFSCVWTRIIGPIAENLILIGEATSPHHAWVVGALESAVHGIFVWLTTRVNDIEGAQAALDLLEGKGQTEKDKKKFHPPFVGLPPYMDKDVADWIAVNAHTKKAMKMEGEEKIGGPGVGGEHVRR